MALGGWDADFKGILVNLHRKGWKLSNLETFSHNDDFWQSCKHFSSFHKPGSTSKGKLEQKVARGLVCELGPQFKNDAIAV